MVTQAPIISTKGAKDVLFSRTVRDNEENNYDDMRGIGCRNERRVFGRFGQHVAADVWLCLCSPTLECPSHSYDASTKLYHSLKRQHHAARCLMRDHSTPERVPRGAWPAAPKGRCRQAWPPLTVQRHLL